MSYFARLVEHAQLRIGESPRARAAEPILDIVEVEAMREAGPDVEQWPNGHSSAPRPAAVPAVPGPAPVPVGVDSVRETIAVAEAASPGMDSGPTQAQLAVPETSETQVLRQVLEWVHAAGESPIDSPSSEARAAAGETPVQERSLSLPRSVTTTDVQAPRMVEGEHFEQLAARVVDWQQAPRAQTPRSASASRSIEPSARSVSTPIIDHIVEISIGAINVRIEPPTGTEPASRPQPTPGQASPAPGRREPPPPPRLARHYLRP